MLKQLKFIKNINKTNLYRNRKILIIIIFAYILTFVLGYSISYFSVRHYNCPKDLALNFEGYKKDFEMIIEIIDKYDEIVIYEFKNEIITTQYNLSVDDSKVIKKIFKKLYIQSVNKITNCGFIKFSLSNSGNSIFNCKNKEKLERDFIEHSYIYIYNNLTYIDEDWAYFLEDRYTEKNVYFETL